MFSSKTFVAGLAMLVLVGGGCVAKQSESTTSTVPVPQEQKEATVPPQKEQMVDLPRVKIGVIAPLSGSMTSYGENVRRAVQLAQKELGLDTIEFVLADSKCEPKAATAAMTKLINTDKVAAVIGGVCPEAALAAAAVAQQNKIVMVSPASTVPTLSDIGDFIFRTIPSDVSEAVFGANLVYQKGFRKLAILYTGGEYGTYFTEALTEEFTRLGGEVVASETVNQNTAGVETQLLKIREAQPDAFYIVSNSVKNIVAAVQEKRDLNLNIPVFGSSGVKNDGVIAGSKGAAEGITVSTINEGSAPFGELYKKEFNSEPGLFAAQTYDAVQVLAVAFRDGARSSEEVRDILYGVSLSGVSGEVDFDQKGDVTGSYNVFVVKDGKFEQQ